MLKRSLMTLAVLLCFALVAAASVRLESPIDRARQAAVLIRFKDGTCSGTVISQHAILSAAHCRVSGDPVSVDGRHVTVLAVLEDGHDHVIYRFAEYFPTWVRIGAPPKMGDAIFLIGSPNGVNDVFRAGNYAGRHGEFYLYDFNGWFGDSGAGIFNARGELVAVHSGFLADWGDGAGVWRIQAEHPMGFKAADWARMVGP